MRNLILFLIKSATFFELLLLETVAFFLIVSNEGYHSNVVLSSCNRITANLYAQTSAVKDYFSLTSKNKDLSEENTALLNQVKALKTELEYCRAQMDTTFEVEHNFGFIAAKIIQNSTHNIQNYILLDKGSKNGVKPEMGVVNEKGVVGIVKTVSKNFAVVLPIINPQLKISSRLKTSNYFGSLVWDCKDPRFAQLEDVPRHISVNAGDSVFTSGFSAVFPEGFLIGMVEHSTLKPNAANHNITVRLACDFRAANYVKIIQYHKMEELRDIEEKIEQ